MYKLNSFIKKKSMFALLIILLGSTCVYLCSCSPPLSGGTTRSSYSSSTSDITAEPVNDPDDHSSSNDSYNHGDNDKGKDSSTDNDSHESSDPDVDDKGSHSSVGTTDDGTSEGNADPSEEDQNSFDVRLLERLLDSTEARSVDIPTYNNKQVNLEVAMFQPGSFAMVRYERYITDIFLDPIPPTHLELKSNLSSTALYSSVARLKIIEFWGNLSVSQGKDNYFREDVNCLNEFVRLTDRLQAPQLIESLIFDNTPHPLLSNPDYSNKLFIAYDLANYFLTGQCDNCQDTFWLFSDPEYDRRVTGRNEQLNRTSTVIYSDVYNRVNYHDPILQKQEFDITDPFWANGLYDSYKEMIDRYHKVIADVFQDPFYYLKQFEQALVNYTVLVRKGLDSKDYAIGNFPTRIFFDESDYSAVPRYRLVSHPFGGGLRDQLVSMVATRTPRELSKSDFLNTQGPNVQDVVINRAFLSVLVGRCYLFNGYDLSSARQNLWFEKRGNTGVSHPSWRLPILGVLFSHEDPADIADFATPLPLLREYTDSSPSDDFSRGIDIPRLLDEYKSEAPLSFLVQVSPLL